MPFEVWSITTKALNNVFYKYLCIKIYVKDISYVI